MRLSQTLQEYLQKRIDEIKRGAPGWLSSDGSAVMVDGGIGYGWFVSPQGDAFIEEYEFDPTTCSDRIAPMWPERVRATPSCCSWCSYHPALAELLPSRPADAITCESCSGDGFVGFELRGLKRKATQICRQCCGLGSLSPMVFQDSAL